MRSPGTDRRTTPAADDAAREQLRSVAWLVAQLNRRQDALIVALKDRGASWTDLARLTDPDDPEPTARRSAMQCRYEAGRRRAGLPTTRPDPSPGRPSTARRTAALRSQTRVDVLPDGRGVYSTGPEPRR